MKTEAMVHMPNGKRRLSRPRQTLDLRHTEGGNWADDMLASERPSQHFLS